MEVNMRKYIIFVFLAFFSLCYLSSCGHEHNYVESSRVEATCDNPGSITYTCECGESYQDSIEALGHKMIVVEGKEATCTTDGYASYQECERCDYTESEQVIKALGHDYKTTTVDATCLEKGYTLHECSRCKDTFKDSYVDATGHKYVNHPGVAATCLEGGYKDYQTCENCEYTTYEEIKALQEHFRQRIAEVIQKDAALKRELACGNSIFHENMPQDSEITPAEKEEKNADGEHAK